MGMKFDHLVVRSKPVTVKVRKYIIRTVNREFLRTLVRGQVTLLREGDHAILR